MLAITGIILGITSFRRSVAIDGVKYSYDDTLGGYVASAADTSIKRAIILEEVDGKPVLALADEAFKNCAELVKITLPDSLIRVGHSAFDGCGKLEYTEEENGKYLGSAKNPYLLFVKANDEKGINAMLIKDGAVIIAHRAFHKNENLVTVIFP